MFSIIEKCHKNSCLITFRIELFSYNQASKHLMQNTKNTLVYLQRKFFTSEKKSKSIISKVNEIFIGNCADLLGFLK